MSTMEELFGPVISSYTRKQAIEDGVLVDAMIGDFAEVSQQHYKHPIAMTGHITSSRSMQQAASSRSSSRAPARSVYTR